MPRMLGGFITYDTANITPTANTLRNSGGVFSLSDHIQYLRNNSWPEVGLLAEYLIVAGGGGGGANHAGGGGAGGLLNSSLSLKYNQSYTITVGAGGNKASSYTSIRGYQGSNSSITSNVLATYTSNIISVGGGGGGNRHDYAAPTGSIEDGGPGGSGGGGGGLGTSNLTGDTGGLAGANVAGQGFPGGSASYHAGAGGGGAGGPGQSTGSDANGSLGTPATSTFPGNGGPGRYILITGANVAYAGGGGGGGWVGGPYIGSGGVGGGGSGQLSGSSSVNGTDGLGGGGGGANGGGNANGGNGGSGNVIIAYQGPPNATGGSINTTSRPGYTVHTFSSTGTFTLFSRGVTPFLAGNQSATDLRTLASSMVNNPTSVTPATGGSLTVNGVSLGNYEYTIKKGDQTISSFTNSDWFTSNADNVSAWIAVDGNLTINSGQTLTPSNRKLFTVVYVKGNLTINGNISMDSRGANHSTTTSGNILIATGTFSGITNPIVPSIGGAGASGNTAGNGDYGRSGVSGGTGGGGGGGAYHEGAGTLSGAGAAGTSFSGGPGGGATTIFASSAGSGTANGGAGGAAGGSYYGAGGGAGNPGGSGSPGGNPGASGTGGVLVIICTGTLSGSGGITARGANGGLGGYNGKPDAGGSNGGSSGGGSITVMAGSDSSSITPLASGGIGVTGAGTLNVGGPGGAGTARKLTL